MATMNAPSGPGIWHSFTKKDPETNLFIAHCLNFDIKVAGRNPDEAWQNLKTVLKEHYEYCSEFDAEGLNCGASELEWSEYNRMFEKLLKEHSDCIRIDVINLVLRPPKVPEQIVPLSCHRVECASSANVC